VREDLHQNSQDLSNAGPARQAIPTTRPKRQLKHRSKSKGSSPPVVTLTLEAGVRRPPARNHGNSGSIIVLHPVLPESPVKDESPKSARTSEARAIPAISSKKRSAKAGPRPAEVFEGRGSYVDYSDCDMEASRVSEGLRISIAPGEEAPSLPRTNTHSVIQVPYSSRQQRSGNAYTTKKTYSKKARLITVNKSMDADQAGSFLLSLRNDHLITPLASIGNSLAVATTPKAVKGPSSPMQRYGGGRPTSLAGPAYRTPHTPDAQSRSLTAAKRSHQLLFQAKGDAHSRIEGKKRRR